LYFESHDANVVVDSDDTDSVVPNCSDDARDVSAMPAIVERVIVIVEKVPPNRIVDVAVVVVVDAVSRYLSVVRPDVVGEIFVPVVDTRIENGHHDIAASGGGRPGLECVDVGIRRTTGLPLVIKPPQEG